MGDISMSSKAKQNFMERLFENSLWMSRFSVISAVVFSLASALILFIVASLDIINVCKLTAKYYLLNLHLAHFHADILGGIIGAIDLYLIGIVMLLFSFGVYELFISKIDVAHDTGNNSILDIRNLDELKNKITKVIIMVLVVSFFKRVLEMKYATPLDMLYFAISIFALATGLYFLNKHENK